jgi:hypothetical protein
VFSHPDVAVVVFVVVFVELVKSFCAHHVDGHLQTPMKKPPSVFDQEVGGPQRKSVSVIEEKQSAVLAKNQIRIPCFCI